MPICTMQEFAVRGPLQAQIAEYMQLNVIPVIESYKFTWDGNITLSTSMHADACEFSFFNHEGVMIYISFQLDMDTEIDYWVVYRGINQLATGTQYASMVAALKRHGQRSNS